MHVEWLEGEDVLAEWQKDLQIALDVVKDAPVDKRADRAIEMAIFLVHEAYRLKGTPIKVDVYNSNGERKEDELCEY